jgi:hypothetical protein
VQQVLLAVVVVLGLDNDNNDVFSWTCLAGDETVINKQQQVFSGWTSLFSLTKR